jgi:hypothetical protein
MLVNDAVMKARAVTAAEREAQIVALWNGRPRQQCTSEHVGPFYNWLVDYAPWLVPRSSASIERVRELVEAHTTTSAEVSVDRGRRAPRQRRQRHERSDGQL